MYQTDPASKSASLPPLIAPIYSRQPEESEKAWSAFLAYRDLGLKRTLGKTARLTGYPVDDDGTVRSTSFQRWPARWRWRERAHAWDTYLQKKRDDAVAKVVARDAARVAAEWERRRVEAMERAYSAGLRLIDRAEAILDLPIVEVIVETDEATGKVTHVHKPMRGVTPGMAAAMATQAVALQCAVFSAVTRPIDQYQPHELRAIARSTVTEEDIDAEMAEMTELESEVARFFEANFGPDDDPSDDVPTNVGTDA